MLCAIDLFEGDVEVLVDGTQSRDGRRSAGAVVDCTRSGMAWHGFQQVFLLCSTSKHLLPRFAPLEREDRPRPPTLNDTSLFLSVVDIADDREDVGRSIDWDCDFDDFPRPQDGGTSFAERWGLGLTH